MRQSKYLPEKTLRLLFGLGVFLPFLVASFTSQSIGADFLEIGMIFCMVFVFSFLTYWIVAKAVMQLLED
ncbi:hypothetical protein H9Q13_15840 [Pontibacter sp. JH31]|uniref:Uncharacterized protein n=1 Tax=Pontibacter aquaedesilientis TaxID=2766980 RepID=A0ABR7XK30_9BACT|nr:hypothetical protein [Pontibacter aquaedesilientis]MBD1398645.1 hypothetical protein [Pontibacter aquaedesilientis]